MLGLDFDDLRGAFFFRAEGDEFAAKVSGTGLFEMSAFHPEVRIVLENRGERHLHVLGAYDFLLGQGFALAGRFVSFCGVKHETKRHFFTGLLTIQLI